MSALKKLEEILAGRTLSKEQLLQALAKIFPEARPEHKALIRQLVLHLAGFEPPKDWHDLRRVLRSQELSVDPSLLLPFVEDVDWRKTTRSAPDWGKFVVAQVLRARFGLPQEDLPSVFAALGDAALPLKKAVSREAHIRANPSGTGRHPKREHEKADTKFLQGENDRRPLEREPDPQPEKLQWLVPKRYDPLEHVLRRDEVEHLLNAGGGKTRQLVELLLQGFEVHEAAEAIGITPNSASVLIHKFRKKISRKR